MPTTQKDHIRNILRDVAKTGPSASREYLDMCAEMIQTYVPPVEVPLVPVVPPGVCHVYTDEVGRKRRYSKK